MKRINSTVIPAQPGYRTIYAVEGGYAVADCDILAWRIETFEEDSGHLYSESYPIELDGEAPGHAAGVVGPDGRGVTIFEGGSYSSLHRFIFRMKEQGVEVTGAPAMLTPTTHE